MSGGRAIKHERMRFRTLSPAQSETRLDRITDLAKMENFFWTALEFAATAATPAKRQRYLDLAIRAKEKMEGQTSPGHQYDFSFIPLANRRAATKKG